MTTTQRPAPAFWWVALAALAVVIRLLSTGILESADGVVHFQIARFSWDRPHLFLDHWGKPLYTLLSSPFAQLGHWGMTLFNALCFVGTCWAADGVLRRSSEVARWVFPPVLLLVPEYGSMVLAGMTEILFGMLSVLLFRLLWVQRYAWAMVVASFMPFARPEYIVVVPFAVAWVLWQKQYKALPFVLTGHIIYGVVGVFVHNDPLWAFHMDPYTGAESIYGRGPLFHFTDQIQHIYGAPLVWAWAVALIACVILWIRDRFVRPRLSFLIIMAMLPVLSILVIHSFLWWQGLKGSLGLWRVLSTGAPLAVLFAIWPLGRLGAVLLGSSRQRIVASVLLGTTFVGWSVSSFLGERTIPVEASSFDRCVEEVGHYVKSVKGDFERVVYFHPQVALFAELDPYDDKGIAQSGQPRANDLMVWDSHFGFTSGAGHPDSLLQDPALDVLRVVAPTDRAIMLGGLPYEFIVLAARPSTVSVLHRVPVVQDGSPWTVQHRLDTVSCSRASDAWCFKEVDFPFEIQPLDLGPVDKVYTKVVVSGELNAPAALVFEEWSEQEHYAYWAQDLEAGPFSVEYLVPGRPAKTSNKLYLWNTKQLAIELSKFKVELDIATRTP